MKKYIVGEDGKIYDKFGIDLEKKKVGVLNCYYIEEKYGCRILYEKEVFDKLKQGDTIEELCDEFIGIYKNQGLEPHFRDITLEGLIEETTKYCYDNTTLDDLNIYGAIWTYEGLKYVAKMNKDGELELI